MTLQIGRWGLHHTGTEVTRWEIDGDTVDCAGWMRDSALADLKALREQGLGLNNNRDEPVVPVVWSDDTTQNGYYEVVAWSCEYDLAETLQVNGGFYYLNWKARLRRVPGWQAPAIETLTNGSVRTNAHFVTAADTVTFHAVPYASEGFSSYSLTLSIDDAMETADGASTMRLFYDQAVNTNVFFDSAQRFYCPPGNYYNAACRVLVDSQHIVGRQCTNSPTAWTIHNGILKVEPGSNGVLTVSTWEDASDAWEGFDFEFGRYTGSVWDDFTINPHSVSILRNSPEVVGIRLVYRGGYVTFNHSTVDLWLRRGAAFVEVYFSSSGGVTGQWGVGRATTDAGTSATGGLVDTVATSGNEWALGSPSTVTKDTTEGIIYLSSAAATFACCVGVTPTNGRASSSATDPTDEDNIILAYLSNCGERQWVAVR